jgi:hypothetical protein
MEKPCAVARGKYNNPGKNPPPPGLPGGDGGGERPIPVIYFRLVCTVDGAVPFMINDPF